VFQSIEDVEARLAEAHYVADRRLATALYLAVVMEKPLLLEGEAGVGKTEVAVTLARILETRLIRLQGYEGIDVSQAVYEWNYARQLTAIRLAEARDTEPPDVFGPEFLIRRPLLQALGDESSTRAVVLLIDEVDRVDDEFEAFLLEFLSDFQMSIPEIGTITSSTKPIVILTSNRTRELHDALKRRCLYHWIEYPTWEKEYQIICARLPDVADTLRRGTVSFVQKLREADLYKPPGVAETLDWTLALDRLGQSDIHPEVARETLGVVLKHQDDVERAQGVVAGDIASD
jgi:MoxR-like ATPase